MIQTMEQLKETIRHFGFLPFFPNDIPGFSIMEMSDVPDGQDGPWEWKGPIAREKQFLYGKFFENKAGFISRDLFADFLNYRRDGYDMDARYDDGLASTSQLELWEIIVKNKEINTRQLKKIAGRKGFDTLITRLQMQTYVIIGDFDYGITKDGKVYGWGMSRYTTPEEWLGKDFVKAAYQKDPKDSYNTLYARLESVLSERYEKEISRLLG